MVYLSKSGRFAIAGTLAVACLLLLPIKSVAQGIASSFCTPAALDVRPEFYNGPGKYFTMALNLRNISEDACIPNLSLFIPRFAASVTPHAKPFGYCDACEDRLPNGQIRWRAPLLVNPGETAHQTFRWKTAPNISGGTCKQLADLGGPEVLIVAPTLLKRVCSDIEVSRYYLGPFPGLRPASDRTVDYGSDTQAFVISSSRKSYDEGEMFFLHVSLAFPGAGSPTDDNCPTLFLRVRGPDGSTRIDETQPAAFKGCRGFIPGLDRDTDWQSGFEVDSGVGSKWGGIGQHTIELLEAVSSTGSGKVLLAHSNELTVQIQDPALISRRWGPNVKGVAVDVTLDKATCEQGEDVSLHIAMENLDADVPVYAVDAVWDPCTVIHLQVWTSQGQLLPVSQRSGFSFCMGHGRGPALYPPGKLVPLEQSLRNDGWLPTQPGTYLIVVTWPTLTRSDSGENSSSPAWLEVKPYATVTDAATFRIVSAQCTDSQ